MKLKRTNFYYPAQLLARLKTASDKTGLTMSELIRRAVENLLMGMGF